MANGAEISQQGVPVDKATDDQKVLDTRWKTLDIFREYTYQNTVTLQMSSTNINTNYLTIFAHNLGYIPAHDYVINSYSVSDPSALVSSLPVYADTQNIYLLPHITSFVASPTLTVNITGRVYTLDITTYFQAPTVNAISTNNPTTSEFGAEFINPNLASPNISTDPIGEFNFSTKLKPLNILQCGTIATVSGGLIISYNYPVNPIYLLAQYLPNGFTTAKGINITTPLVGSLGFQGGRGSITSNTITVNGVQTAFSGSFAYILLKDPIGLAQ